MKIKFVMLYIQNEKYEQKDKLKEFSVYLHSYLTNELLF